jgi:hypothetical protein
MVLSCLIQPLPLLGYEHLIPYMGTIQIEEEFFLLDSCTIDTILRNLNISKLSERVMEMSQPSWVVML